MTLPPSETNAQIVAPPRAGEGVVGGVSAPLAREPLPACRPPSPARGGPDPASCPLARDAALLNSLFPYRGGLDPPSCQMATHARAEGIETKPSFKRPLRTQRCLLPASAFFEWQGAPGEAKGARGTKGAKTKYRIGRKDGEMFGLAGLYDVWKSLDGYELATCTIITCTIITCAPNAVLAPIHNRMPVILLPEDEDAWLDPDMIEIEAITSYLRPYPDELLEAARAAQRPEHQPERLSLSAPRFSRFSRFSPGVCPLWPSRSVCWASGAGGKDAGAIGADARAGWAGLTGLRSAERAEGHARNTPDMLIAGGQAVAGLPVADPLGRDVDQRLAGREGRPVRRQAPGVVSKNASEDVFRWEDAARIVAQPAQVLRDDTHGRLQTLSRVRVRAPVRAIQGQGRRCAAPAPQASALPALRLCVSRTILSGDVYWRYARGANTSSQGGEPRYTSAHHVTWHVRGVGYPALPQGKTCGASCGVS